MYITLDKFSHENTFNTYFLNTHINNIMYKIAQNE